MAECHPSADVPEGSATLKTAAGELQVVVVHSDRLHQDAVRISFENHPEVLDVLSAVVDPWSGTPCLDGEPCRLLFFGESAD